MPLLSSRPKLVDYSQPSLSHQPPFDPFPFLKCYLWLFIYVTIFFSYVVILIFFSYVVQMLHFSQLLFNCPSIVTFLSANVTLFDLLFNCYLFHLLLSCTTQFYYSFSSHVFLLFSFACSSFLLQLFFPIFFLKMSKYSELVTTCD
jgi:hypothetical protein